MKKYQVHSITAKRKYLLQFLVFFLILFFDWKINVIAQSSVSENIDLALQARATRGDADAQYQIGKLYFSGIGINKDLGRALYWYTQAAAQNYVEAQEQLGNMYFMGDGVARDDSKAFIWWDKAAHLDDVYAQNAIAGLYETGRGIKKNYELAIYWYKKAAIRGYADSELALANLYYQGKGTDKNDAEAFAWYLKAAEHGNESAYTPTALGYVEGDGTPQDFWKAAQWAKKAVTNGDPYAANILAHLYYVGQGLQKDHSESAKLYLSAAQFCDITEDKSVTYCDAMFHIAADYLDGDGIEKNQVQAAYWMGKAANRGETFAEESLAWFYLKGIGLPMDEKKAIDWFQKAASQGDIEAENTLKLLVHRKSLLASSLYIDAMLDGWTTTSNSEVCSSTATANKNYYGTVSVTGNTDCVANRARVYTITIDKIRYEIMPDPVWIFSHDKDPLSEKMIGDNLRVRRDGNYLWIFGAKSESKYTVLSAHSE